MHLYLQRKLPPAKTLVLSRKEEEESCFCGSLILARHLSMGCLMRFDVGTNARRVKNRNSLDFQFRTVGNRDAYQSKIYLLCG
jgi:hypothetical protein